MDKSITKTFSRKYLLVLGLLFAVSLAAFFVFQELLSGQVSAEVINLGGRQRMLVNRIALHAAMLADVNSPYDPEELRGRLRAAADDLEKTFERVRAESRGRHFMLFAAGEPDLQLSRSLARIEGPLAAYIAEARAVADAADLELAARQSFIQMFEQATGPLLADLDRFVETYGAVGNQRNSQLEVFAVIGEAITIILLMISGLAVFRPLVQTIGSKIEELEHLERYYRSILNNVGDGVVTFDEAMTTRSVNATYAAMAAREPAELVGRPVLEAVPELARFGNLFGGVGRRFEFEHIRPDGSKAIYEASIQIFEFGGDLQCIVSLRDISERKDLEDRLRLFYTGIEHNPLSVVITDTHGVIEYANRSCVALSGYSPEEIIGSNPRIFRSGATPNDVYRAMWQNLMAGREWRGEILNKRKNGELYWESEVISPLKNDQGAITHFIAIKEDITEPKRQAAQLIEAKRQAEIANRSKSEFLANMSHELRTPLNAIIGFAEIMKMEMFGAHAVPKYQEYSHAVYDSARHLLGIINDVLDFSKLEAGRIRLVEETVAVGDLVDAVLLIVRERAAARGVHLEIETPAEELRALPALFVDPLRFKQVMLNILSNAIKFTPEGGRVSVAVKKHQDASLSVLVSDTGIGMKEEDIPRALERFGQIDGTLTRRYEGTGLGLPISKSLVELHGGTLQIKSRENAGTTVIIHLPAERMVYDTSSMA